tara:strand:- start:1663 stop:2700 length:1038 start_codon:yes stop_codon:yes gene_type:complete
MIPRRPLSVSALCGNDENAISCFLSNNPEVRNDMLLPGRAYCTSKYLVSPHERSIVCPINSLPARARENLSCIIDDYGNETHVLAAFNEHFQADLAEYQRSNGRLSAASHSNTFAGSAAAVMTARNTGFVQALQHYQNILERLNNLTRVGRGASAQRSALRREAIAAYELLNQRFQYELNKLVPEANRGLNRNGNPRNKGNALSNPQRAITLAERGSGQGIYVADGYRQSTMGKLANAVRYVGPGVLVLDAGIRISTVRNERRIGGDWHREAAVQSAGFAAAAGSGLLVGGVAKAGLVAAKITLMATPVGWCLVIGAAAIVGYGVATSLDSGAKSAIGTLWDRFR